MVLFGLYMVPRKLSRLRDYGFLLTMCVGAVLTTLAAHLLVHGSLRPAAGPLGAWLSFSCGPVWTLGMLFYTLSVSQMGLTLATPIKNTTAILGTVLGLAVFAEWRETNAVLAIIGSALVVACAVVLARCSEPSPASDDEVAAPARSTVTPLGVVFAVLAALFFAAYTIPMKLAQREHVGTLDLMEYMAGGTLLGGLCLFGVFSRGRRAWLRASPADHAWAALSGVTWALATVAMTQAITRIGLAITWPVTNLNTIVTVAAGILLFREVDLAKHARTIALAMACAIAGTVLLGFSRT